jgi:hypothetical protein
MVFIHRYTELHYPFTFGRLHMPYLYWLAQITRLQSVIRAAYIHHQHASWTLTISSEASTTKQCSQEKGF